MLDKNFEFEYNVRVKNKKCGGIHRMAEIYLTPEGYKEKEQRLEYLKGEKRQEVIEKLKTAREFGDLSENAEYDAARDEQGKVEAEIEMLEETLRVAKIVDPSKVKSDTIQVGSKVKLLDIEFDEEVEYSIVGSLESNPNAGLISNESPIGKSIIGKKKGDLVIVETPAGKIEMRVLEVL